jgi:hypothetical protein
MSDRVAETSGHRKSFQAWMKVKRPERGERRDRERQHDLPEDREARGVVELGRLLELARDGAEELHHQEHADGHGDAGRDRAKCVLCSPQSANIVWSGRKTACSGIIRPAIHDDEQGALERKSSRAKA